MAGNPFSLTMTCKIVSTGKKNGPDEITIDPGMAPLLGRAHNKSVQQNLGELASGCEISGSGVIVFGREIGFVGLLTSSLGPRCPFNL